MPNQDGTGPAGKGPRTGRGQGNCPVGKNPVAPVGRGLGCGAGRGVGAGRRLNRPQK